MMRTQIQLGENQHRRLKELAHRRGVSLSAVLRDLIEEKLADEDFENRREEQLRAVFSICGKYSDPKGSVNVSEKHDEYLAEALTK